jgi:type VI secretion system secreted protein VgrG
MTSAVPSRGGNAPGDAGSGTWVRLAQPSAGANWGTVLLPRVGSEVLVGFVGGDIDQPVVVNQLHNDCDLPPYSAGVDSGVNHPGVLSGLSANSLTGADALSWVLDDAMGQSRMRLLSSAGGSELGLGHLIQQAGSGANRGAWRGSGFEARTAAWVTLRAAEGLLVSASTRAQQGTSVASTQMDAAEATAQIKAAQGLGGTLGDAAAQQLASGLPVHLKEEKFAYPVGIAPAIVSGISQFCVRDHEDVGTRSCAFLVNVVGVAARALEQALFFSARSSWPLFAAGISAAPVSLADLRMRAYAP